VIATSLNLMTINSLFCSLGLALVTVLPAFAQEAVSKKGKLGVAPQDAPRPASKQNRGASGGNSWFPVTVRDLGVFYGQGEAVGQFKFTNPNDAEINWRGLNPSCQCASADITIGERRYRVIGKPQKRVVRVIKRPNEPEKLENVSSITIGPREEGLIETRLNMHNITGAKSATLEIHSTDPVEPQTRLTFRATGAELFTVSPKEVNLNKMTWNESREFTVMVSAAKPDWQILSMDDAGSAFDVKWEKVGSGTRTSYKITGKYGPVNAESGGGGMLKFRTNVNGAATFNVRVLAFVQGPLEVKPGGFLTLGLIRKGKPIKKSIVFEPNDGLDLRATEMVFEKLTLGKDFIKATQRKDGVKLIVELTVADNAPTGLVKGELVVKLNHPLIKEKRIMFNGFVR
jgi:hypothetical protein